MGTETLAIMDRYFDEVLNRDLHNARTIASSEALDKARDELVNQLPEAGLGDKGENLAFLESNERVYFSAVYGRR